MVAGGLLIDGSLLLEEGVDGSPRLSPSSATLLRRLRYSNLRLGIIYGVDASQEKVTCLVRVASLYSFDCISLDPLHLGDSFNSLLLAWRDAEGTCFLVASLKYEKLFCEFQSHGWRIICKSDATSSLSSNNELLVMDSVEQLPIILCSFNKKAMHSSSALTIGYVMKPSREEDFAKRGAFPMHPTQNGLMFTPITFGLPLSFQLQEVDAVLIKATDEIISINSCSSEFPHGIQFSEGIMELGRYIEGHLQCHFIDPISNIHPLLDRVKIQEVLLGLEDLNLEAVDKIRAPRYLTVDDFQQPNLKEKLLEAKLSFPVIVKPQIACGVADAHNMALVFKLENFEDISVPLPAIVQEYVDHGSLLFKFYVLGDKVFHAVKKSMPNSKDLLSSVARSGYGPLMFNSLKSLPTEKENQLAKGGHPAHNPLNLEGVMSAANWLRRKLDLTIFGFDVVIQEGSNDHVIVDLNYLPSFKEVPDDVAIPAFWDAIKSSCQRRAKEVSALAT